MATFLPTPEAIPQAEARASAEAEAAGEDVRRDGDPDASPRPAATLASIAPGESALVVRVDTSRPIGQRLVDLGFVPGTRVRVIRRAPLGDPVTYEVRGTRLCLRRSEAVRIEVSRCSDGPASDPTSRR